MILKDPKSRYFFLLSGHTHDNSVRSVYYFGAIRNTYKTDRQMNIPKHNLLGESIMLFYIKSRGKWVAKQIILMVYIEGK